MQDGAILAHIRQLIAEEHWLWEKPESTGDDGRKLAQVEAELDQCWDLLRQRRALREFGDDPEQVALRDARTVERYIG